MEVDLVGQAAHAFTSDWSREGHRQLPGPEDITAFVGDYERARGAPFTRDQRRGLFARVVSSMAYGARCQLSMHPARQGWPEDTFVHLVLTAAEDLLVAA
jgi:hypothetical protein